MTISLFVVTMQNKHQSQRKAQKMGQDPLRQTQFSAAGSTFSIDIEGYVYSSTLGCLGHEEEVLSEGQILLDLIDCLQDIAGKT